MRIRADYDCKAPLLPPLSCIIEYRTCSRLQYIFQVNISALSDHGSESEFGAKRWVWHALDSVIRETGEVFGWVMSDVETS